MLLLPQMRATHAFRRLLLFIGVVLCAAFSTARSQTVYNVQVTPDKSQLAPILLTGSAITFERDDRVVFDPPQPDARFEPPTVEYGGLRATIQMDASLRTLGPRGFKVLSSNGQVKFTGTLVLTAPEPQITSVSVIKDGELSDTLVIERGEQFNGFLVVEGQGFYPGSEVKLLGEGFKVNTRPLAGDISNDRIRTSLALDGEEDIRAGQYVVTVSHGHHPTAISQLTVVRRENSLRRYALTVGSTFDFIDGVSTGSFYSNLQAYLPDLWVWGPSSRPFTSVGLTFSVQQGRSFSYDTAIAFRDPRTIRFDTAIVLNFSNEPDTNVVMTTGELTDTSQVMKRMQPVRFTAAVFVPVRQWINLIAGFDYRRIEVTEQVTNIVERRQVVAGTASGGESSQLVQTTTRIVDDPAIWGGILFPIDDYPAKGVDMRLRMTTGYGWSFLSDSNLHWEILWNVLIKTGDIEVGGYLRGRSSTRPELLIYVGKQFDVIKIANLFD